MTSVNVLHRTGRGSKGGGITLQIEKKVEMAGALKAYIYITMDAQLNIQNRVFISAVHKEMLHVLEPHTALFMALTGVGKMHLTFHFLEWEYFSHFEYVIILCLTLIQ